jgi:hypothetical protein
VTLEREVRLAEMARENRWNVPVVNPTTPDELRHLSGLLHEAENIVPNAANHRLLNDLESRVRMSCNPMMDGDGGPTFLRSHKAAVNFIAWLLHLRASEMEYTRQVEDYALIWKDGVHS